MLMRTSECPLWYLTYRTEEQEIMGLTRALLLVLSRNLSRVESDDTTRAINGGLQSDYRRDVMCAVARVARMSDRYKQTNWTLPQHNQTNRTLPNQ